MVEVQRQAIPIEQMQFRELQPGFWDTRAGCEKLRDIITEGMHLRKIWTASIHFMFHIVKYYMELQPSKDGQPSLNYHMQSPTLQDCLKVCKMYPCYFFNYSMEHTEEQWMLTSAAGSSRNRRLHRRKLLHT